jgi:MMP 1-O-methyltransferase
MYEYLPWFRPIFDLSVLEGVDGWLTDKEANLLYRLARRCKGKGAIVEIGSWKGRSSICLAIGSQAGAKKTVHAIDPHTGSSEHGNVYTFDEFQRNIKRAGVAPFITPHVRPSTEVAGEWSEPVELIWIDGAHEYEFVSQDFDRWFPHVVEGGTMAFHDSTLPGPMHVLEREVYKGTHFHRIRFVHGITYATKGKPTPLRNCGMLLLRDITIVLWRMKQAWKQLKKRMRS